MVPDHVHVLLPGLPVDGSEGAVQRQQGDQGCSKEIHFDIDLIHF